jgi:excisionase family DNA binding protein
MLTTSQAADLLGVSRPTVIKLLDEGKIPYERIGTHRRIQLRDVLYFREERREEQYRALDEMAILQDDEEDVATALARLRNIRQGRKIMAYAELGEDPERSANVRRRAATALARRQI